MVRIITFLLVIAIALGCKKDGPILDNTDTEGAVPEKLKQIKLTNIGFKEDHLFKYFTDTVIEVVSDFEYEQTRVHIFENNILKKIHYSSTDPEYNIDSTIYIYETDKIERFDYLRTPKTIKSTFTLEDGIITSSYHEYPYSYQWFPTCDSSFYTWSENGLLKTYQEYTYTEGLLVELVEYEFTYTNIPNPVFRSNLTDIQTIYKFSYGGYSFTDFNQNCTDKLVEEIKIYINKKLESTLEFQYEIDNNRPLTYRLLFYTGDKLTTYYDYTYSYY